MEGRRKGGGGAGVGCVAMGVVCGWGREERGRGRGRKGERQLTTQNLRTHTSNPFFLAWFVGTEPISSSAISRVKASGTCRREAWLVIFDC